MKIDLKGWTKISFGTFTKQKDFTIYKIHTASDMFETTELSINGEVICTMIENINEKVIKEINKL